MAERIGALRQELEGLQRERLEQEKLAEKAAGSRDLLLAYEDYLNNQLESERHMPGWGLPSGSTSSKGISGITTKRL